MSAQKLPPTSSQRRLSNRTIFGYPRDFLDNKFVYLTVSPSARGLAIGVNMLPAPPAPPLDLPTLSIELTRTLVLVQSGALADRPAYRALEPPLRQLRHVALSGDGEPTSARHFARALDTITHIRALRGSNFFKIVLVTDGTRLDSAQVREGLQLLTSYDEIWIQLDVTHPNHQQPPRRPPGDLTRVLANVSQLGQMRPVVIQSWHPSIEGDGRPDEEIDLYLARLQQLVRSGTQISRVQLYSVPEFEASQTQRPLPLVELSALASRVRSATGLPAEIF